MKHQNKFKQTEIGNIPEDWEVSTLGEKLEIIGGGTPKTTIGEYWGGDIPWISVADFVGDKRWIYHTEKNITNKGLENSSTKLLHKGQLIISARGTVGELGQVTRDMAFNQSCYGIDGKGNLDNDFLYYLLKQKIKEFQQKGHGAVFNTITMETFNQITISVPKLSEQRLIASILSSLDSKIELNQRMNQTLESIGQALFKHWFIDFEFPNEKGKPYNSSGGEMVESEMGRIPRGWQIVKIEDLCKTISNGGTPNTMKNSFWNGDINWYTTGELKDNPLLESEKKITEEGLDNSSCKLWDENTILIALYASPTVGRLGLLKNQGTSNQACSGLMAKDELGYPFLFCTLQSKKDYFNHISVGAAQQNISGKVVKETKTVKSDEDTLKKFTQTFCKLMDKRTTIQKEIKYLSKIRDSLLPKLMSGEIRTI